MFKNYVAIGVLLAATACMAPGHRMDSAQAHRVTSLDRVYCEDLTEAAKRRHGVCGYEPASAAKARATFAALDLRCDDLREHVAARLPECALPQPRFAEGGMNGTGPGNGRGNGPGNGPGNGAAGPESSSAAAGPGGASASGSMGGSGGESSSASAGPGGASASASMGGN